MDQNDLLSQLEELAGNLHIEVRYEVIKKTASYSTGGLCRLKGEWMVIIHSKAPIDDKIDAIAYAVKRFDLSSVYLKPGLREFLDNISDKDLPPIKILEEE